jgi:hypothetical protein
MTSLATMETTPLGHQLLSHLSGEFGVDGVNVHGDYIRTGSRQWCRMCHGMVKMIV